MFLKDFISVLKNLSFLINNFTLEPKYSTSRLIYRMINLAVCVFKFALDNRSPNVVTSPQVVEIYIYFLIMLENYFKKPLNRELEFQMPFPPQKKSY